MIFIYDIVLNWCSERLYDFFEWEDTDKIDHIKRIPLFRVDKEVINDFINNEIFIDKDFCFKIYNMTENYLQSTVHKVPYAFLITDGITILAVKTDKEGKVLYKSKLLLSEEEEIICISTKLKKISIIYSKRNKHIEESFLTRKEITVRDYLIKELETSFIKKDYDKINYLYMEYTGKEETNIEKAYRFLINNLKKSIDDKYFKLYELLQMIGSNN